MTAENDCDTTGGLDEIDIELVVRLQLEDVEDFQSSIKGKQRDGSSSDIEHALLAFRHALEDRLQVQADQRMAKSFADAVSMDADVLSQILEAEELAAADHELARNMDDTNATVAVDESVHSADDSVVSRFASLRVSKSETAPPYDTDLASPDHQHDEDVPAEGSSSASYGWRVGHHKRLQTIQCEACQEHKTSFETVEAPCGHSYCALCIGQLFQLATSDESLYPPRCCRLPIPLESAKAFLDQTLRDAFAERQIEMETPNRIYCFQTWCSAFIHPEHLRDDFAYCTRCNSRTCVTCKGAAHADDCPADEALQSVLELARTNDWQRCQSCRGMVELNTGCNHITCRCGAEFCYICGTKWKDCACAQWNEERLLARADVLVQRDAPAMPIQAPVRLGLLREAAQLLLTRHDCKHSSWRYVSGAHCCEECSFHLPLYIFECRRCRLQACNRCRRNRL